MSVMTLMRKPTKQACIPKAMKPHPTKKAVAPLAGAAWLFRRKMPIETQINPMQYWKRDQPERRSIVSVFNFFIPPSKTRRRLGQEGVLNRLQTASNRFMCTPMSYVSRRYKPQIIQIEVSTPKITASRMDLFLKLSSIVASPLSVTIKGISPLRRR